MQNKMAVAGIEPDSKNSRWLNSLPTYHYTTEATGDAVTGHAKLSLLTSRIVLRTCASAIYLGSISDILISYKKGTILYREKRGLNRRLLVLY